MLVLQLFELVHHSGPVNTEQGQRTVEFVAMVRVDLNAKILDEWILIWFLNVKILGITVGRCLVVAQKPPALFVYMA
jgi:hypothetical protein